MTSSVCTIIVTQRERFGMTEESIESLFEHTPDANVVYVDGGSPRRVADVLRRESESRGFRLIRHDRFLTPNEARNIGVAAADTEYVVFCDNDVIFSPGWLDRLVDCASETGADVVAPLTCQGMPVHTEIHHAGGDYAPGGDMEGFFASDPEVGRAFDEVMHGHRERLADVGEKLRRQETGMCEFHCTLVRRSVFDRIGPLDEQLLSTKEHIDFCMCVKQAGGEVWFEPTSIVTYVFPCRARPMNPEDWPFFALRWSNAYGRRSLEHFIEKWNLKTEPEYVSSKRAIYMGRRLQGMLIPMMRRVPLLGRNEALVRRTARLFMAPERIANETHVLLHDLRRSRLQPSR